MVGISVDGGRRKVQLCRGFALALCEAAAFVCDDAWKILAGRIGNCLIDKDPASFLHSAYSAHVESQTVLQTPGLWWNNTTSRLPESCFVLLDSLIIEYQSDIGRYYEEISLESSHLFETYWHLKMDLMC